MVKNINNKDLNNDKLFMLKKTFSAEIKAIKLKYGCAFSNDDELEEFINHSILKCMSHYKKEPDVKENVLNFINDEIKKELEVKLKKIILM